MLKMTKEEIQRESQRLKDVVGEGPGAIEGLKERARQHFALGYEHLSLRAESYAPDGCCEWSDNILTPVREDRLIALAQFRAAVRDLEAYEKSLREALEVGRTLVARVEATL